MMAGSFTRQIFRKDQFSAAPHGLIGISELDSDGDAMDRDIGRAEQEPVILGVVAQAPS